jgi:hypothetical protein
MGDFDGVGEAVTGAMLARAVEPAAGEPGPDGHTHEAACLNCRTLLSGPYCTACGQKAHIHRSLRAFFADFAAGVMNFEGKIWRTLPMLAWRPGDLTRRYIEGERARFVSPVALYLFSVFAMFAVLSFNGVTSTDGSGMRVGVGAAVKDEAAQLARLEARKKELIADKADVADIDRQVAVQRRELDQLRRLQRGEMIAFDGDEGKQAPGWLKDVAAKAQKDPGAAVGNVWDAASKYSWLLIPISVPFLWLLFPFSRRFRLYDHTVFVTYSLSFMMALVIMAGVLVAVGVPGIASLLFFIPPVHMYRQLKGAYGLSRISALLRTIALVTFAIVAGTLFFVTIFAIGIL